MKISALTTCVGERYAAYLKKSLGCWSATLDELLVVTDEHTDFGSWDWLPARLHRTDIFTRYGASFNKGAALSEGFAILNPTDWVLNFDADILPPADWRTIVERHLPKPGELLGCSHRYREDGSLIPDADYPNIWGFFHLWHVASPYTWRRPVFDPTCGHAGNYDHTFMMQWPEKVRVDLWPRLRLVHQGEPREQWFGRDPKNDRKMTNLFALGLWDAWATRAGHITLPSEHLPTYELVIDGRGRSVDDILSELAQYTDKDPFKYRVTVKP